MSTILQKKFVLNTKLLEGQYFPDIWCFKEIPFPKSQVVYGGDRSLRPLGRKDWDTAMAPVLKSIPCLCFRWSQGWTQRELMLKFRALGLYIPGWWFLILWKKWCALWKLPRTQDFTNDFKVIQLLSVECRKNLGPREILAFPKCTIPGPSHHAYVLAAEDFSLVFCWGGGNFRQQIILRKMKLGILVI